MNALHLFTTYLKCNNYSDRTIKSYSFCLNRFLSHFKKSPQNITSNEIREFLSKQSQSYIKQTIGALNILYSKIIPQPQKVQKFKYPRKEKEQKINYVKYMKK